MPTESGFSNQKKLGRSEFKTIHDLGSGRFGVSVTQKSLFDILAVPAAITAVTPVEVGGIVNSYNIELATHGMNPYDPGVLRFTSGNLDGWEVPVASVIDANNLSILAISPVAPEVGDLVKTMGWVSSKADSDGNVNFSPGPTQFVQDGSATQVIEDTSDPSNNKFLPTMLGFYKDGVMVPVLEDTVTPANNEPLPVKLTGVTGDVIINAGDLSVAVESTNDSVAIGDSITGLKALVDTNATSGDNELHVRDDDAVAAISGLQASLTVIEGVDYATEATLATLATETTLGAVKTAVESIAAEDFATETTLAQIALDTAALVSTANTDGNPSGSTGISIGGKDGSGDFQQVAVNAAGELSVTFGSAGFATETTLSALNNKVANNFGVATGAVRTAAQVGNASGAADFNDGASSAQTLRVSANLKRAGNDLSYNSGTSDANTLRVNVATDSNLAKAAQLPSALGVQANAASLSVTFSTEMQALIAGITSAVNASVPNGSQLSSGNVGTLADSVAIPSRTVGFLIQGYTGNVGLYWALGATATNDGSSGHLLEDSRDSGFIPYAGTGNLSIIGAEANTLYNITWFTRS